MEIKVIRKDSEKSKTSSAVTPGGGFKFGAPSSNSGETSEAKQQPTTATGGFKFNVTSSDSSSAANKPEVSPAPPPSGGFKFGIQETGEAVKPAGTTTTTTGAGFSFGQKPESDGNKPATGGTTGLSTTTVAPLSGGFTFGAGGSKTTTVKSETDKPGAGGVSFTAPAAAATAAKTTEPKVEFKPGT